jgi:DNA modification methylase
MNDRAIYANANALTLPIADRSVHMIATSPPYWGLRSYDTGDNKHAELGAEPLHDCGAWSRRQIIGYRSIPDFEEDGDGNMMLVGEMPEPIYGKPEPPCGGCYVCNMRTWGREMHRVLRDDGVLFLNLADSYSSGGQRAISYGTSDKEPGDCLERDCSSENPCDACREASRRKSRNGSRRVPTQSTSPSAPTPANTVSGHGHLPTSDSYPLASHTEAAIPHLGHTLAHVDGRPRASQASTPDGFSQLPPEGFHQLDSSSFSQDEPPSFSAGFPGFSHRMVSPFSRRSTFLSIRGLSGRKQYKVSIGGSSARRTEDTVYDSYPYLDSNTTQRHGQNLPAKNLCGIPWRVALALQADGWYLRSDVIWAKPNPMPESVTDRPTKAHEYVFVLTKAARYFWDAEGVKEGASMDSGFAKQRLNGNHHHREMSSGFMRDASTGTTIDIWTDSGSRNLRTVWTIATAPYSGAHFATWPPALVERMIRAGTSERGVCSHRDTKLRIKRDLTPEQQARVNQWLEGQP